MKTLQIFEPPMCCSTGVCGPEVDQRLVTFAADVEWARQQGAEIQRFNLAQQPTELAHNPVVRGFLERFGEEGLPLILVDGEITLVRRYPSRAEMARWIGLPQPEGSPKPVCGCRSWKSCC